MSHRHRGWVAAVPACSLCGKGATAGRTQLLREGALVGAASSERLRFFHPFSSSTGAGQRGPRLPIHCHSVAMKLQASASVRVGASRVQSRANARVSAAPLRTKFRNRNASGFSSVASVRSSRSSGFSVRAEAPAGATVAPDVATSMSASSGSFNWKAQWYPVAFIKCEIGAYIAETTIFRGTRSSALQFSLPPTEMYALFFRLQRHRSLGSSPDDAHGRAHVRVFLIPAPTEMRGFRAPAVTLDAAPEHLVRPFSTRCR